MIYDPDQTFPMPFSGISKMIKFPTPAHYVMAVTFLTRGCNKGHGHKYAVDPDKNTIYTTTDGTTCLMALTSHKVKVRVYNDRDTPYNGRSSA